MIKISKKYLTKIIKEETAKVGSPLKENAAQAAKAAWEALPPQVKAMIIQYVAEKGPELADAGIEKLKGAWKNKGSTSMSDDDLMDYSKECPQGWKDADCMVNKINDLVTSNLKSIMDSYDLGDEHKEKIVSDLIFALEEPLLDLALEVGGSDEDSDLMQEDAVSKAKSEKNREDSRHTGKQKNTYNKAVRRDGKKRTKDAKLKWTNPDALDGEENLDEVYSEKQRKWACANKDTKPEVAHMCTDPMKK